MLTGDKLIQDPEEALAFTANILNTKLTGQPAWVFPMSGGKDSTATAQSALVLIERGTVKPPERMVFFMGDTVIEFRSFLDNAKGILEAVTRKARSLGIEAEWFMTQPNVQDDFWVRIIGKGFAPPTANMRWCTDKLKIAPNRRHLQKMGLGDAPVALGVRYGESERRDKYLSCTLGGECGPDAMSRSMKNTVEPIVRWRQCAVWDFLNIIAPEYGFDNSGLRKHYGPDGDMRYGCWACPLIFNDKTAEFLARDNPIFYELIRWTDAHLRRDGQAWQVQNREFYKASEKAAAKDGRLSPAYCRRLFDELTAIGHRHGMELLLDWQIAAIKAEWAWRERQPKGQAAIGGQGSLDLSIPEPATKPMHISAVTDRTASTLAAVPLVDDAYHREIREAAGKLARDFKGDTWRYHSSGTGGSLWESLNDPGLIAYYRLRTGMVEVGRR